MFDAPKLHDARLRGGKAVPVMRIHTDAFKDQLAALRSGYGSKWECCFLGDAHEEFERSMQSERKRAQLDRYGQTQYKWIATSSVNHFWDCCVYQIAVAHLCGLFASELEEAEEITEDDETEALL
jgi:phage terminase large subunit GpA-like protein